MYSIDDIINGDVDGIEEDNVENENDNIQEENDDNENEEVKKEDDDDKPAKKTRPKTHRLVLNAETLKGPRGLICMEKTFNKLKFRGHGHEQRDLDMVMNSLQNWCHRLYPKYTFDDSLEQIERLGNKKTVGVMRKKIIMNMLNDEIFADVPKPDSDDDNEPITRRDSPPKIDQFDLLMNEGRPPVRQKEPSPEIQLTEEQIEMMERNRMLAAERRRARLEALQTKENMDSSSNQITLDEVEAMIQ